MLTVFSKKYQIKEQFLIFIITFFFVIVSFYNLLYRSSINVGIINNIKTVLTDDLEQGSATRGSEATSDSLSMQSAAVNHMYTFWYEISYVLF